MGPLEESVVGVANILKICFGTAIIYARTAEEAGGLMINGMRMSRLRHHTYLHRR